MDTNSEKIESAGGAQSAAPKGTYLSMVLNGIGNGTMVGAIPFMLIEIYSKVKDIKLSPKVHVINGAITALGAVIGGIYGHKEAKSLERYRKARDEELGQIKAQIDDNTQKIDAWAEKVKTPDSASQQHIR